MEQDTERVMNICGESVCLGPLRRDLIPYYQKWNNDLSTSLTLGLSWPTTREQEAAIYDQRTSDSTAIYFTIYHRSTDQPIGIAYLYEVSARHARASFGILIGSPENRGKGHGTEVTRLVLDYAFNAYGLENVMLTVLSSNVAGIRAYERAGFKAIGIRRRCSRLGGSLQDLIYMECVAGEFDSPVLPEVRYHGENARR